MARILFVIVYMTFPLYLEGQIKLCKKLDTPTNNCQEACLYCVLDGLKGRNTKPKGILPTTFCSPTTDNAQWIPFLAGSRDLTLEVSVTDCFNGSGLEIGLFNGMGCSNLASISSCFTDVNVNTTARIVSVLPLTLGEMYWLLLDGNIGDICSWEIKVTEGSANAPDLKEGGSLHLPSSSCINQEVTAIYTPPPGTKFIEWKLNNTVIDNKNKSEFSFSIREYGSYTVCVTASNACHKSPTICKTINTGQTKIDTIIQQICSSEKFRYRDSAYSVGIHPVYISRKNLCDSVIYLKIIPKETKESTLKRNLIQVKAGDSYDLTTFINKSLPKPFIIKKRDSILCSACHEFPIRFLKNDTMIIEWKNRLNCIIKDSLFIDVIEPQKVILPNIIHISPINYTPIKPYIIQAERYIIDGIQIYDRWGNIVHSSMDDSIDQYTTLSKFKEGVYIWKIILSSKNDSQKFTEYKTVTVIP